MAVNVVLLSPQLNLTDNTTCQLVNSGLNINFFTIDIEFITEDTPLGNNIVNVNAEYLSKDRQALSILNRQIITLRNMVWLLLCQ